MLSPTITTVTEVKFESKRICKSIMCGMSSSDDLSVVLTFENSSLIGLKFGQYGGAPTS